jgi:hypothetical protein
MANSESIKKYLIEGNKPYLEDDANNGNILMLSGAWGSGKTHFWKNVIETDLIPKIKAKEKSYIFVSLYGKDSIKDIENEILQKAYSFLYESNNDIIKKASSVFTKSVNFIPKISLLGFEIDPKNIAKLKDELSHKEELQKAYKALTHGIVCFDDFERKSSKIDLNDLFGFITNLTENFQMKTTIITNQEAFQNQDQKVFNTVKEKSINKFILYNPSIEELFEVICHDDKYKLINPYKVTILDAIKLSEEKNARIYIQVLTNCLEYTEKIREIDERIIYLVALITIIFVKHNLIIRMDLYSIKDGIQDLLPNVLIESVPNPIYEYYLYVNPNLNKEAFLKGLKRALELKYTTSNTSSSSQPPIESFNNHLVYVTTHGETLFTLYKYYYYLRKYDLTLLEKINNFVESGILLEN